MTRTAKPINLFTTLPWILMWVLAPAPLYIWAIVALFV